jgi:hypothetical protein
MAQFTHPPVPDNRFVERPGGWSFDHSQQGVIVAVVLDADHRLVGERENDEITCLVHHDRLAQLGRDHLGRFDAGKSRRLFVTLAASAAGRCLFR